MDINQSINQSQTATAEQRSSVPLVQPDPKRYDFLMLPAMRCGGQLLTLHPPPSPNWAQSNHHQTSFDISTNPFLRRTTHQVIRFALACVALVSPSCNVAAFFSFFLLLCIYCMAFVSFAFVPSFLSFAFLSFFLSFHISISISTSTSVSKPNQSFHHLIFIFIFISSPPPHCDSFLILTSAIYIRTRTVLYCAVLFYTVLSFCWAGLRYVDG